jgi:hypothetical protein
MSENDLVSVDWVVNKLGLSDLPKQHSLEIIAAKLSYQNFELYFDQIIVGSHATSGFEFMSDENDFESGALILNGYCIMHEGKKVATNADTYHIDGRYFFAINEYYFHDERFYPSDAQGMAHKPSLVDVDLVSFDRNQVISCTSSNHFSRAKGEQGLLKALALLAREMADNSPKFRHGSKVNAKAFKDHVVDLAKVYLAEDKVPDGNIRKLDERINKALNELDLKDIT